MTKEEFVSARTRIISNMLDNPDEHGIYPTTKCFNELDALYDELIKLLQSTPAIAEGGELPTDEEIIKAAKNYIKRLKISPAYKYEKKNWFIPDFIEGAKWMRSQLQSLPKEPLRDESKNHDTPSCSKCGGRTALVSGGFDYEPDAEPYNNGIEEKAKIDDNATWIHGYVCDDCGNVQGLWHE